MNTLITALNRFTRKRKVGLVKLHVFTGRKKEGRRNEERRRNKKAHPFLRPNQYETYVGYKDGWENEKKTKREEVGVGKRRIRK